jgi:hypothetical protein
MGFGQHQSFYLRPQWLHKGMLEIKNDSRFFYEEDHFERLGIGKNMAKSVRHWMIATNVVKEIKGVKTEHCLTSFGELVERYDPYLQKNFTKGMLHYFLTTNEKVATSWYWFFNYYKENVFDKNTLLTSLDSWVKGNLDKSVSITSLRRDIDCIFQTYTLKKFLNATPEDVIRSPFEELGLLTQTIRNSYTKMPIININGDNKELFFSTLLVYMNKHDVYELDINELTNSKELWGKVFNLPRSIIVETLEEMKKTYPIVFTRTNRLDTVRINEKLDPYVFIEKFYNKEVIL